MREWLLLRRKRYTASALYVQCGVRLDERDIERVRGDSGNLRNMSCGQLLRWWRNPARFMRLQCRVLLAEWCGNGLRGFDDVVYGLHGRQFMRGQRYPASTVHVLVGAFFD